MHFHFQDLILEFSWGLGPLQPGDAIGGPTTWWRRTRSGEEKKLPGAVSAHKFRMSRLKKRDSEAEAASGAGFGLCWQTIYA